MILASDLIDRADFYEPLKERADTIPDRKYHRIGDVAKFIGVETHVLRYWETQFSQVRPKKSSSGHRLYRTQDVLYLLLIHALLHTHRFTIVGAKRVLKDGKLFMRLTGQDIPEASTHSNSSASQGLDVFDDALRTSSTASASTVDSMQLTQPTRTARLEQDVNGLRQPGLFGDGDEQPHTLQVTSQTASNAERNGIQDTGRSVQPASPEVSPSLWRDLESLQKDTERILDDVREVSIRLREQIGLHS